ncbi:MAG: nucleotidyltransferase domain-containing protein [bacterium]|nr:nucleotidyltransferase domain-containing protein [bacterium]
MEKIFSTQERVKILKEIVFKSGEIGVSKIASQLELSKGLVSKYFGILSEKGILEKEGTKHFVTDNTLVRGIKILLNISGIPVNLFRKYSFITAAGLFGSCAKGENTEDSDFDLWVFYKNAKPEDLARFSSEFSKYFNNLNILFLTSGKLKEIKDKQNLFYNSLLFSSIIILGDNNALHV